MKGQSTGPVHCLERAHQAEESSSHCQPHPCLILPWINVKYLASSILSLTLRRLSSDWLKTYGHPLYLAETFDDNARFKGTCYQAGNWHYVGQTKGSAKKGNEYRYHGQRKLHTLIPCIVISGGSLKVTRDEAIAIVELSRDDAVDIILDVAEKAEEYDQLCGKVSSRLTLLC